MARGQFSVDLDSFDDHDDDSDDYHTQDDDKDWCWWCKLTKFPINFLKFDDDLHNDDDEGDDGDDGDDDNDGDDDDDDDDDDADRCKLGKKKCRGGAQQWVKPFRCLGL